MANPNPILPYVDKEIMVSIVPWVRGPAISLIELWNNDEVIIPLATFRTLMPEILEQLPDLLPSEPEESSDDVPGLD